MTMEKYGVARAEVLRLIQLGICADEEEALVKVASGQADGLIKEATRKNKNKEEPDARGSK